MKRDYAITSDGTNQYYAKVEGEDGLTSFDENDTPLNRYIQNRGEEPDCQFYSDRPEGRKKYWIKGYIPESKYAQPDSEKQQLIYYGEIEGKQQEWYYSFSTFADMVTTIARIAPVTISNNLRNLVLGQPQEYKAEANIGVTHNYMASIEHDVVADEYKTSVYVFCEPEDLL